MNILAIDTASDWGSVAIRAGGQLVFKLERQSTEGFAHVLFPLITEALQVASMPLGAIDCFAAGSGPGSFTGVRVALSVAKGLADANGKRAAGISNLRAMAVNGNEVRRAVLLDARRGDVYAAVLDTNLQAISPEVVTKLGPWLDTLDAASYQFILPAQAPFRGELARSPWGNMSVLEAPVSLAASIAVCAEMDAPTGCWSDPALLDANYVRRSDAELFWREA